MSRPRPEANLTPEARRAVINANIQSGAVPQGTSEAVLTELREAGLVRAIGLTNAGRAAHGRLVHAALEEL